MSLPTKYYIGIDFGSKFTRAAVLVESADSVKLFDIIELPLHENFANNSERYKAGFLDISNYLKARKIILKSAVTNLDNRFIKSIPHVVEIKNRIPFNSLPRSLLRYARRRAMSPNLQPDEKIVDQYLGTLSIDGKKTIDHMTRTGSKLRQDSISIVTKTSDYVELINASHDSGVFIEDVVLSNLTHTYLTEKMNLTPQEFSLFIDFGSRMTKVCFFNQQRVLAVENFETGGEDVTLMIMEELGLEYNEAEKLKTSEAFKLMMQTSNSDKKNIRLMHRLKNENYVLLQLISHYATKYGMDLNNMKSVVISGGGANLAGLQEMIIDFYHKSCEKVGEKSHKYFLNYCIKPEVSCAVGLAYTSYLKRKEKITDRSFTGRISTYFSNQIENLLFTD